MAKATSPVPPYCDCTSEQWEAAKATYARMRLDPAWHAIGPIRRSTLAAQMNSGRPISAELAIEYEDLIASRNYRPIVAGPHTAEPVAAEPGTVRDHAEHPYAVHPRITTDGIQHPRERRP